MLYCSQHNFSCSAEIEDNSKFCFPTGEDSSKNRRCRKCTGRNKGYQSISWVHVFRISHSNLPNSVSFMKVREYLYYVCYAHVYYFYIDIRRSQWPRGLRRGSAAARLLGLRVWIPPGTWMSVCCESCVLSCRVLCIGLITHPEESYQVWCVWVWSWILDNEEASTHWVCCAVVKKVLMFNRSKYGESISPCNDPSAQDFCLCSTLVRCEALSSDSSVAEDSRLLGCDVSLDK